MKVVLNGKEAEIEILNVPFVALPEIKKVCDEETLRMMVTAGLNRFAERKQELGDGIYSCRMLLPQLTNDDDKMVLFMLQGRDTSCAPVIIMLWREAVASGLLPFLQAMVDEAAQDGKYRTGPGAIAFKDLLEKSGIKVPTP